jgi:hypothetical protein
VRALAVALLLPAVAGCAGPIVYRDPVSGRTVDCTALARGAVPGDPDAARAAAFPLPGPGTGQDVPRLEALAPGAVRYDAERQCAQELAGAGWGCVSGCR